MTWSMVGKEDVDLAGDRGEASVFMAGTDYYANGPVKATSAKLLR